MSGAPIVPDAPVRLDTTTVAHQAAALDADIQLRALLDALLVPAALLNDRRQIIAANRAFCAVAGTAREESLFGDRLGDALRCCEARHALDGCGTAQGCSICGAGSSLARLERGEAGPIRQECRIIRTGQGGEEALDFEIGITRLPDGLTLMVLRDISDEKRRRVLERIFFHDVLNTAGNIVSLAELAESGSPGAVAMLRSVAEQLVEEIRQQQAVAVAERGELEVHLAPVDLSVLANALADTYRGSAVAVGRRLRVAVPPVAVKADPVLLGRVLGNLLRNAFEATPDGGEVVLEAGGEEAGQVAIRVINAGELSPEVAVQIFHRSFSTKGPGRGLGTWSVRLFTERYLGGTVALEAAAGRIVFTVRLPAA